MKEEEPSEEEIKEEASDDDEESSEKSYVPGSSSDQSYDHKILSEAESEIVAIEPQSDDQPEDPEFYSSQSEIPIAQ